MTAFEIILASSSPRRRELLQSAGVNFRSVAADVNEDPLEKETPRQMVARLAQTKAQAISRLYTSALVIGSDTTVVGPGGQNLGKPTSPENAAEMLALLSGATHQVFTAVAILCQDQQISKEIFVSSDVTFRLMSAEEIADYVKSGEPVDRAGSYAIQGKGAAFVSSVHGSYTSVVGLPLVETLDALKELGAWSSKNLL